MNGLDLFSGIGGITLALKEFVKTVAYCEIDPYCQSVLLSRMQEGNLPKAPITLFNIRLKNIVLGKGGVKWRLKKER